MRGQEFLFKVALVIGEEERRMSWSLDMDREERGRAIIAHPPFFGHGVWEGKNGSRPPLALVMTRGWNERIERR